MLPSQETPNQIHKNDHVTISHIKKPDAKNPSKATVPDRPQADSPTKVEYFCVVRRTRSWMG
jgi:hypothetical protein